MNAVTVAVLAEALRRSWWEDTTNAEDWSPEQASRGQCAVTALVVQEYLGGDLLRTVVDDVSHYWNRLPDGEMVDLTRDQFASFNPAGIELRSRDYVLSYPDTELRFRILSDRARVQLTMEPSRAPATP